MLRIGFMPQDVTGGSREGQGSGPPVGHSALLRDGVTPHAEAHTHDGAGDEDEEDHRRTDQEVQEGVEEGASAKDRRGRSLCASARRQLGAGPGWGEGAMQGHQGTLASPALSPSLSPAQSPMPASQWPGVAALASTAFHKMQNQDPNPFGFGDPSPLGPAPLQATPLLSGPEALCPHGHPHWLPGAAV